jgi:hypothetical protein
MHEFCSLPMHAPNANAKCDARKFPSRPIPSHSDVFRPQDEKRLMLQQRKRKSKKMMKAGKLDPRRSTSRVVVPWNSVHVHRSFSP